MTRKYMNARLVAKLLELLQPSKTTKKDILKKNLINVTNAKKSLERKAVWNCTVKFMMTTNHINARPAKKPSEPVDSLESTKKGIPKTNKYARHTAKHLELINISETTKKGTVKTDLSSVKNVKRSLKQKRESDYTVRFIVRTNNTHARHAAKTFVLL